MNNSIFAHTIDQHCTINAIHFTSIAVYANYVFFALASCSVAFHAISIAFCALNFKHFAAKEFRFLFGSLQGDGIHAVIGTIAWTWIVEQLTFAQMYGCDLACQLDAFFLQCFFDVLHFVYE